LGPPGKMAVKMDRDPIWLNTTMHT